MTAEQEAKLLVWYHEVARDLPWRRSRELYPVLVSEFMLQQTTVAAVVPLFERWMARFPDMEALAQAPSEAVMQAWSGLGYYSRAKRLHAIARHLSQGKSPPSSLEELRSLPGLGPYTAAAVASIALGLPHLALDTNALRVLLRLYGWETRPDLASVAETLRRRVEQALPKSDFGLTNQAIMELGATLCRVKAPACLACPLGSDCQARREAIQDRIPTPKPRKPVKITPASAYMVAAGDALVMVRGTSLGLLGELFGPPIDFFGENPPRSALTPLLEWLRPYFAQTRSVTIPYGISGRRLELKVQEVDERGLSLGLIEQAQRCGVEVRVWREGEALPISSLTRKALKAWRESRAAFRLRDEKSAESWPQPPARRC